MKSGSPSTAFAPARNCSMVGAPLKEAANFSLLARSREIMSLEADMLKRLCLRYGEVLRTVDKACA